MAKTKSGPKKGAGGVPFTLGQVGHFGLSVRKPRKSAKWFERALGWKEQLEFDDGVAVGNENVTIALHKRKPSSKTLGHMSFPLPKMMALQKALARLQRIEVPGDEIRPESAWFKKNMGICFNDPDGYRWESSVQGD